MLYINGASCQQVNVEGRRAPSAGSPVLQRIDFWYADCPGMQLIRFAICKQFNVEGHRTSSAGVPDLHRIDFLYAGCPGMQHINGASCQQFNVEGLRTSSAGCTISQRIDCWHADCPGMQHINVDNDERPGSVSHRPCLSRWRLQCIARTWQLNAFACSCGMLAV